MSAVATRAWDWRLALNHEFFDVDGVETFHAYDVNNNAACEPMYGLISSVGPPNEGSNLCRDCMTVVRSQPRGRSPRSDLS